jgi:hypothetical protein
MRLSAMEIRRRKESTKTELKTKADMRFPWAILRNMCFPSSLVDVQFILFCFVGCGLSCPALLFILQCSIVNDETKK